MDVKEEQDNIPKATLWAILIILSTAIGLMIISKSISDFVKEDRQKSLTIKYQIIKNNDTYCTTEYKVADGKINFTDINSKTYSFEENEITVKRGCE